MKDKIFSNVVLYMVHFVCHGKVNFETNIYCYYISLTTNIYLISLVFSESGRLSLMNGINARHKEELNIRRVLH